MSGATIAPTFLIGPRIVGQILGLPYQHFNPTNPLDPLGALNPSVLVGTLPCWITGDKACKAATPFDPAKPIVYGLFDVTQTNVKDYLVGPLGTFFIASQDVPHPITLTRCNRTLTISRPAGPPAGPAFYSGDTTATETPLMIGYPALVIQGTKGEKGETTLPGDTRVPWVQILMPYMGVELRSGDQAQDELLPIPNRYTFSGTELTARGWRITAMLETP
jgi:hypothetical protein